MGGAESPLRLWQYWAIRWCSSLLQTQHRPVNICNNYKAERCFEKNLTQVNNVGNNNNSLFLI